jgi:hypothetical protein
MMPDPAHSNSLFEFVFFTFIIASCKPKGQLVLKRQKQEDKMASSKQEIIDKIAAHIADRGGSYSDWYVGITENAKRRLFEEHGVEKEKDKYISRTATSSSLARLVEKYFLDLGCDGGSGGGDDDADIIYAYKKSSRTDP